MNLDWLGERIRPLYGQVILWVLLACALCLAAYFLSHHGGAHPHGPRNRVSILTPQPEAAPPSLLSLLPDALLQNRPLFWSCGALFVLGAILWVAGLLLPWSGWLCALSFTAVVALYLENASQATHVAHLTNVLLLLHALWYHFYAAEIRHARREGCFWQRDLYPRWVHSLSVFAIGMFYGLAGLSKLLEGGLGWANGVSLQLWVSLWGNPDSLWTQLILDNRNVARALQWATLLSEVGALPALFLPRFRLACALALVGFHIGQIAVFAWGFHANMILLLLVFAPPWPWIKKLRNRHR
jgi:hypothetical protein